MFSFNQFGVIHSQPGSARREQGRREPSGAAKTLLKIAELRPEALKAAM